MFEIYMVFKGKRLLVEKDIDHWFTAIRHCELYFNRNPKEYVIVSTVTGEEHKFHELY